MAIREQRMLSLAPPLFAALDALAVQTNSVARRGPNARKHSWYVMIERIAAGDIIIQEREPYRLPAGLAEQADAVEARQRERAPSGRGGNKGSPMQQLNML